VYLIRAATAKDMQNVEKLTELVFNDTFVRDVIEKEEEFDFENARLLFDESGKLASTVFIIPRKMYFEGKILELGGIGGVATDPAFRGKGYANFLMQDAILNMKKRKFDLSILYPFKVEYYAKFGYRDINIPFGVIKTDIDLKISNKYEIRDADLLEKKDIKELERIYNEFCKNLIGPIKRTKIYWQQKFEKNKKLREKFFIARKNNEICGYLILDRIKLNWQDETFKLKITECIWDKKEIEAKDDLVKAAIIYAARQGFKKLFFDKFQGFDIEFAKEPDENDFTEHKNLKYIKMYKILNWTSLLNKIKPVFNNRLNGKNFDKVIKIIHSENDLQGKIKIMFLKTGNILEMDEGIFIKMLLGLKKYEGVNLQSEEIELLHFLFPEKLPVFFDFDYL